MHLCCVLINVVVSAEAAGAVTVQCCHLHWLHVRGVIAAEVYSDVCVFSMHAHYSHLLCVHVPLRVTVKYMSTM